MFFFFFLLFGLLLLSNCITFLFLIHFKRFKLLRECHLKFYKSSLNSNSSRATYKEFFGCSKTGLCSVRWNFVFLSSWPPLLWGAVTFSFLIFFTRVLVYQMCQEEGFKFCLNTRNNRTHPLDPACPNHLSVWSPAGLPYPLLLAFEDEMSP
jgi:hypothetical protein